MRIFRLAFLTSLIFLIACSSTPIPTPLPTATATATFTPAATSTALSTATTTPTETPKPTATATKAPEVIDPKTVQLPKGIANADLDAVKKTHERVIAAANEFFGQQGYQVGRDVVSVLTTKDGSVDAMSRKYGLLFLAQKASQPTRHFYAFQDDGNNGIRKIDLGEQVGGLTWAASATLEGNDAICTDRWGTVFAYLKTTSEIVWYDYAEIKDTIGIIDAANGQSTIDPKKDNIQIVRVTKAYKLSDGEVIAALIQNGKQIAATLPDSLKALSLSEQAQKNAEVIPWSGDTELTQSLTTTLGKVNLNMDFNESLRLMKMVDVADNILDPNKGKNQVLGFHPSMTWIGGTPEQLRLFMEQKPSGAKGLPYSYAHIEFLALTSWSIPDKDNFRSIVAITTNKDRQPIVVMIRQRGQQATAEWIPPGYYFFAEDKTLSMPTYTLIRSGQFFSLPVPKEFTKFDDSSQDKLDIWILDKVQTTLMAWHDHFPAPGE